MPRMVAVDWDRREARCVLASAAGGKLRILMAKAVPLVDWAEGGESRPDVAGSLRALLDDPRAARAVALVGVDRADVEMLDLALPPAKESELPELVGLQAFRESQATEDDAIVDFIVLGTGEEGRSDDDSPPTQVMAAVLTKARLDEIQTTCSGAGLKPARILLRPLAAASLFARRVSPTERVCLLVSLVGDEADLNVLADGRVVFQRTVRLPEGVGEEAVAQRLTAEIQRTLLVAQQGPLGPNPVEKIFLFGGAEEHTQVVETVTSELGLPASMVDPFEITDVPDDGLPEHPGRFAALVGMILDESYESHTLDFLHPKRPPAPMDRRRIVAGVASAIVLAIASLGYWAWSEISVADDEVRRLSQEVEDRKDLLKQTAGQRQLVEAIRAWEWGEVNWLDEIRDLSVRFPPARDMILQRMTMTAERSGGGGIEFSGMARDPMVVTRLEQNVRDEFHEVRSRRIQERAQGKGYPWVFETSMSVAGRDKESYVEQQAAPR